MRWTHMELLFLRYGTVLWHILVHAITNCFIMMLTYVHLNSNTSLVQWLAFCLEQPKTEFQVVTLPEPKSKMQLNETSLQLTGWSLSSPWRPSVLHLLAFSFFTSFQRGQKKEICPLVFCLPSLLSQVSPTAGLSYCRETKTGFEIREDIVEACFYRQLA